MTVPHFSVFWDGELHIAFEMNVPELLKFDATQVVWKNYGMQPYSHPRTGESIRIDLEHWLHNQVQVGNLWYDRIRERWRYHL